MLNNRILVIDDEPEILTAYERILAPRDSEDVLEFDRQAQVLFSQSLAEEQPQPVDVRYRLILARQGLDGVEVVKRSLEKDQPIALAFIDLRMPPGIDGLETAKQLLAIDHRLEITLVTAFSDRTRREIARELGRHRFFYLKKPFDADEIRQLAEMLTFRWRLNREREQLDKEKAIFISNMSHELRHPLGVIVGICDTLLNCRVDETRRIAFLKDIETEAVRLTRLTENLDRLQKSENQAPPSLGRVDPEELIDRVIRLLEPEAATKGLQIGKEFSTGAAAVLGNRDMLMQVLINLTLNAIQYTEKGEVKIRLGIAGDKMRIAVADTGMGIPNSEQLAVFKPFYRSERSRTRVSGHGLGLTIVQELVHCLGSEIRLDSEPGRGSCFYFDLPPAA